MFLDAIHSNVKNYGTAMQRDNPAPPNAPYFRCSDCYRIFFSEYALNAHRLSHSVTSSNVCKYCAKSFLRQDALKLHLKTCIERGKLFPNEKRKFISHYFAPQSGSGIGNKSKKITKISSAFKNATCSYRLNFDQSNDGFPDCLSEINSILTEFSPTLQRYKKRRKPIKVNYALHALFVKQLDNQIFSDPPIVLLSEQFLIIDSTNIAETLSQAALQMDNNIISYSHSGSGWAIHSLLYVIATIWRYIPLGGGSNEPPELPEWIQRKNAVVQIVDIPPDECFRFAVSCCINQKMEPKSRNKNRKKLYEKYQHMFNFEGLDYPLKVCDIKKFESKNRDVSIAVIGIDHVYEPYKVPKKVLVDLKPGEVSGKE